MSSTSSSTLLSDSLASFSKSAYQAFAEIEKQARSEVAHAIADASQARNERDKAASAVHAAQLEAQEWKQEAATCKSSLKQAEITISHQAETISQLRREANQWKDQSRNWQEHFLRVEQERCALSTRIEELVAERLRYNHLASPHTPNHVADINISAPSSTTTKRASTSSLNQPSLFTSTHPASPPRPDTPSTSVSCQKPVRSETRPFRPKASSSSSRELPPYSLSNPVAKSDTQTKMPQNASHHSPARTKLNPRQTLIRRVQAVIHVKQEDSDDESTESTEETRSAPPKIAPQIQARKRKDLPHDDEYVSEEQEKDELYDTEEGKDKDSDYCEDEICPSDEEDELMMGAEENHHELYGTRRVKPPGNKPLTAPAKKRKIGISTGREKSSAKRK